VKRRSKSETRAGTGTPLTAAEVLERLAQIELEGLNFIIYEKSGHRLRKLKVLLPKGEKDKDV